MPCLASIAAGIRVLSCQWCKGPHLLDTLHRRADLCLHLCEQVCFLLWCVCFEPILLLGSCGHYKALLRLIYLHAVCIFMRLRLIVCLILLLQIVSWLKAEIYHSITIFRLTLPLLFLPG